MKHKSVLLPYHGELVEIDEKIAPLIQRLWDLEIDTLLSCEDNVPAGFVWICFPDCENASRFLNMVAAYASHWTSDYSRIMLESGEGDKMQWQYSVLPENFGVDTQIVDDEVFEDYLGFNDIRFSVSIRFPQSDLPWITRKLGCPTNQTDQLMLEFN